MSNEVVDGIKSEFVKTGNKLVIIVPSMLSGGVTHDALPPLSTSQFDLKQTLGKARNLVDEVRKHISGNN